MNAFRDAASCILFLLGMNQRFLVRRFNTDKDGEEVGLLHQVQQLPIVSKIQRRFGGEHERVFVFLLPLDQMRQESFHRLLVADQIVIDKVEMPAPTQLV